MLSLSQDQRDRLVVLRQWQDGLITAREGAERLRLTLRHFRRLCRRLEADGDAAVRPRPRAAHGGRRYPQEVRTAVLERARLPLYRDFGPTLLSEHLPFAVPSWTVRRWLLEAGLWVGARRSSPHRRRRPRRSRYGELVLMDTSEHDWLEGRSPEKLFLIAMIDDATSDLHARFFPGDTGVANQLVLIEWLQTRGRLQALYTDQASHFSRSEAGRRTRSVIRRALEELGGELILALSPQAKGRVERLFGTLQDRLVKEMRVAGVSSMAQANTFLEEHFLPFWRRRFRIAPADLRDAHLPLAPDTHLPSLFAEHFSRVVAKDYTVRFQNEHWQIDAAQSQPAMPLQRIRVERWVDGTLHFNWRGQYLDPVPVHSTEKPGQKVRWRPPANHPFRRQLLTSRDLPDYRPMSSTT